jgi:hypothetical protein
MKTQDELIQDLWGVVTNAAKDLLAEADVKAVVRDQVEYAARAQWTIATTTDSAVRELAQSEFTHRTAQIESYLAKVTLDATKKSRLVGILEGLFNVLLKYGPALLKLV